MVQGHRLKGLVNTERAPVIEQENQNPLAGRVSRRLINVHCHLFNFNFIPDNLIKRRAHVREKMLRTPLTHNLALLATGLWPGIKYDRIHEAMDIMNSQITAVADQLVKEMVEAGIILATPLIMDLEEAFEEKAEIPYRFQIEIISRLTAGFYARHEGMLLPFIMLDPRKPNAVALVRMALEQMGYLGVKLYPPFGYHPAPGSLYNSAHVSGALAEMYDYCEANEIPVTSHCSRGGAFNPQLMRCRELVESLAHPANWFPVLKRYKRLYLNLAHLGGDVHNYPEQTSWAAAIERLMMDHEHVYADLAYNDMALSRDTAGRYFKNLLELAQRDTIGDRILLGTDWPAPRHTWTEKAYLSPFTANLPQPVLTRIGFENPMRFLFHDKGLPLRIRTFLKSRPYRFEM